MNRGLRISVGCDHFAAVRHLVFCLVVLLVATVVRADPAPLYTRLGGSAVVDALAAELVRDAARDPATQRSFQGVNLEKLTAQLALQLCEVSGGGCHRDGDSMKDVHAGLGITQQELYAMVQMLRDLMVRHGIALRERNELLALLAPMKRDIVER